MVGICSSDGCLNLASEPLCAVFSACPLSASRLPFCLALGRRLVSHADPGTSFLAFINLILPGSLRISQSADFPKHNATVSVFCDPSGHSGTRCGKCPINTSQSVEPRRCLYLLPSPGLVLHITVHYPLPLSHSPALWPLVHPKVSHQQSTSLPSGSTLD